MGVRAWTSGAKDSRGGGVPSRKEATDGGEAGALGRRSWLPFCHVLGGRVEMGERLRRGFLGKVGAAKNGRRTLQNFRMGFWSEVGRNFLKTAEMKNRVGRACGLFL